MRPEFRVSLLKHPQQDMLVQRQYSAGTNAGQFGADFEQHGGRVDRNDRHSIESHIELDPMERLMIGNRLQKRNHQFRVVEFDLVIKAFVGRNHLSPIGKIARQRLALPQKAADFDAEQSLVLPTPDMQHSRLIRPGGQQRQRKRQRHILRDFQRTRQVEQLLAIRRGNPIAGKVDSL